jgi:GT2 family glycosyltransferase
MVNSSVVLSVIIVTYNSDKIIKECLDSIYKFNDLGSRIEIILVDNSPIERPSNMFEMISRNFSAVVLIKNDVNGGYGYGNNVGINAAKGKYVLILNPDTRLVMPLFKDVVDKFEDDLVAIVGVKLIYEDLKPQISFFIRPEYQNILTQPLVKLFNKMNFFCDKCMITSGSCMFIRRSGFAEIGMFDDQMFLGNEESFIAKKYKSMNSKNRFVFMGGHKIIHLYKECGVSSFSLETLSRSHAYYFDYFNMSSNFFYYNKLILFYVKYFLSVLGSDEKKKHSLKLEINSIRSVFRKKYND